MKQLILTLLFFGLIAGVYAQEKALSKQPPTPEQKAQKYADKMDQALTLTAEQKEQVQKAFLDKTHRINRLKSQPAEDKEAAKKEAALIQDNYTKKLKEILTEEQFTKFEQLKQEKANKPRPGQKKPVN